MRTFSSSDFIALLRKHAVAPVLVVPGTAIPFRGADHRIDWIAGAPRAVRRYGLFETQ